MRFKVLAGSAALALCTIACVNTTTGLPGAISSRPTSPGGGGSAGGGSPAAPKAPPAINLKGSGSVVKKITLKADSPLVATGTHHGEANFIVELIPGDVILFNEIGTFSGQTATADVSAKAYRVKIQADGTWTLKLTQPVPNATAANLVGKFKGSGAKVIPTRVTSIVQPTARASHRGESNFIVELIGYGDLSGDTNVFNEIGDFHGETVVDDELPPGGYLLYVQSDGAWTLEFSQ
jgi:hypothetical protein